MKYTFATLLVIMFALVNITTINAQSSEVPVQIVGIIDTNDDCVNTPLNGSQIYGLVIGVYVSYEHLLQDPTTEIPVALLFDSQANLISLGRFSNYTIRPPGISPIDDNLQFYIDYSGLPIEPLVTFPTSRPWTMKFYSFTSLSFTGPPPVPIVNPVVPPLAEIITLNPIYQYTFDPAIYAPACASLPYIDSGDSKPLNQGNSENEVAVYNATDDNGEPALHIYDINDEGDGTLALEITQDIIAPYIDNPPSENTELLASENGKVTLYILDTGELQINSGPDDEGKIHVLIFDGIPPTNIYGYVIDPPVVP